MAAVLLVVVALLAAAHPVALRARMAAMPTAPSRALRLLPRRHPLRRRLLVLLLRQALRALLPVHRLPAAAVAAPLAVVLVADQAPSGSLQK